MRGALLSESHSRRDIENLTFKTIELVCVIYFTVELVLRIVAARSARSFLLDFLNLVDIAAVLPFYVLLALGSSSGGASAVRVLRLLRVFRIIKFARFSSGLQVACPPPPT